MKKLLCGLLMSVLLVMGLTGCGSNKEKLYVLNWDEYMSDEVIEAFESEYGVDVVVEIAESNEIMYSQIKRNSGNYDIAIPSDYMISQMKQDGMLKELDYTKLTQYNKEKFDTTLMGLIERDCQDIQNYFVPYFWGSLGIMYNTNNLSEEKITQIKTQGWNVLFDKEFSSKMGMYASSRDSIAAALMANGVSLNTKEAKDLEDAEVTLKKVNYKAWATDDLKVGVSEGKYDCALVYSGDFFDALYSASESEADVNFDVYCPKDKNNVFFDGFVIPNTTQNEELAYKFIDFFITYENALTNAQYVGYSPTLKEVYNTMVADPEYKGITDHDAYYPGDITGGEIYQYLGNDIYNQYEEIYKRVKK